MKKIMAFVLLISIGLIGCGKEPMGDPPNNGQDYFNGKVLAVHDTYVDVKCLDVTTGAITAGTQLSVTLDVASANEVPVIEVDDQIRVVFSDVMETDPPKLGTVWGIYMLDEEGNIVQEQFFSAPANSDTDLGITLSTKDVTPTGMTLIITQSGGETTGELQYGSEYHLKVLKDGNWEDVPYIVESDVAWTMAAYMVVMDEAVELEISWERLYGSLQPGTYCISKGFTDFRGTGDYDNQSFYAEFQIID